MPGARRIAAVSFDFFNTLVMHRHPRGRGALVMEYLAAQGWESDPWRHSVLYDVLAAHAHEFAPAMSGDDLRAFAGRVARTLFLRLRVPVDGTVADAHGVELWRILGPDHLATFPDAIPALDQLVRVGCRLAVISNWQHGLAAFCGALGFGARLDVVVSSAEVAAAKPDPRIFAAAGRRLALTPERILHVGDSEREDLTGARAAGLRALWLRRDLEGPAPTGVIRSLNEVAVHLDDS